MVTPILLVLPPPEVQSFTASDLESSTSPFKVPSPELAAATLPHPEVVSLPTLELEAVISAALASVPQ